MTGQMSMVKKVTRYAECLALMRKHDPELQERGFRFLIPHASAFVDELIADFLRERDHGLRC